MITMNLIIEEMNSKTNGQQRPYTINPRIVTCGFIKNEDKSAKMEKHNSCILMCPCLTIASIREFLNIVEEVNNLCHDNGSLIMLLNRNSTEIIFEQIAIIIYINLEKCETGTCLLGFWIFSLVKKTIFKYDQSGKLYLIRLL